jgi:hypothetical protein
MSRPRPYDPVLSGAATTSLLALPKARQRVVGRLLFRLAETPAQPGDYSTTDESGRSVQHILVGEFHLSYWADHATRELRIVEIDEI